MHHTKQNKTSSQSVVLGYVDRIKRKNDNYKLFGLVDCVKVILTAAQSKQAMHNVTLFSTPDMQTTMSNHNPGKIIIYITKKTMYTCKHQTNIIVSFISKFY